MGEKEVRSAIAPTKSEKKVEPPPCPYCGELPKINHCEDFTYSRSKRTAGRKLTAYASHFCVACNPHKKIYAEGSPSVCWGHFDRVIVYDNNEFSDAENKAYLSAIRKWNKLVKKDLA